MMQLDNMSFEKEILKHDGMALVDFYADWCGPCRILSPVLEELSKDPAFINIKFARINIEDYQDLAEKYVIQSIPCMVLFRDGKEMQRIVGYSPKNVLKNRIIELMTQAK